MPKASGDRSSRTLDHQSRHIEMDNEYLKRGYLLPEGCSDLIDVMKLKASAEPAAQGISWSVSPLPIASEITVPEQMTVAELAAALNQKPFRIIGDLIQSGVFATLNQVLDFETIVKVFQKYGFIAKRAV